jgi:hypothetical protein
MESPAVASGPATAPTEPDIVDAPGRCPVDHRAMASACPVDHRSRVNPARTRADHVMRRLLRVPERPDGMTEVMAYSAFQRSMAISALRCTLTYVMFPFVLPAVGFATGVGPVFGILIGVIAMTCDVFAVRRFFMVDHKYRWQFTAIVAAVMVLLSVLLVQDIVHLVT